MILRCIMLSYGALYMYSIVKYPRTQHVEGSRLQPGDQDLSQIRFADLCTLGHIVIEEKIDGANAGISFSDDAELLLQSRGHFLTGGPREIHWTFFKRWTAGITNELFDILGTRYIMYGEWMYAKHTIYYDMLPHYFMEFDIYDRKTDTFLSTTQRRLMLAGSPIVSVLTLYEDDASKLNDLTKFIRPSYFKSGIWLQNLRSEVIKCEQDPKRIIAETDKSNDMEGLYIKVETADHVVQRLKWVRYNFFTSIVDSETHWLDRPIIPNRLAPGIVI